MRTNLKMMAVIAAVGMTIFSCGSDNENFVKDVKPGKAHVKVVCGMGVSVSPMGAPRLAPMTRAALSANGKALTDLYILDYDKATGKLLQVLHQTSAAPDFAEPDLTLDYGEHVLKVVATRSQEPTLWDAGNITWQVEPNILTPITATQPVMLTATKTSDTFGAEKEVSVGIGKATTVSKQRIMCVESQSNGYYTFVPHGTVTRAGTKTKYCILPIRTERTSEEDHVDITVNDEWD